MEIVINDQRNIEIIVEDGDETFPVMLTQTLVGYSDVTFAGYYKEHPLVDKIKIVVRGDDDKKSIKRALDELKEEIEFCLSQL